MQLSEIHKAILTISVARVIIRRGRENPHHKRKFVYDDEVGEDIPATSTWSAQVDKTIAKLSEAGVPFQFPHSVEILLDFTLFDVDEESNFNQDRIKHSHALEKELAHLVNTADVDRLVEFRTHLTRRLMQRTLGESELKFWKLLMVIQTMVSRPDDGSSTPAMLVRPLVYNRWIVEALAHAMGSIGSMDLNLMNPAHFRAYERCGPLVEAMTTGVFREVSWAARGGARESEPPAETWALTLLAQGFDSVAQLPLVRTAYEKIVDKIEQDNVRAASATVLFASSSPTASVVRGGDERYSSYKPMR